METREGNVKDKESRLISDTIKGQAWLHSYPKFLGTEEAEEMFKRIDMIAGWERKEGISRGKKYRMPRLMAWYGEIPYTFAGTTIASKARNFKEWPEELVILHEMIQIETGINFNSVLLNKYEDGNDGVAFHSDNELIWGTNPIIASISLGSTRRFEIKRKVVDYEQSGKEDEISILLNSGDMIVMDGTTQEEFVHRIPKTTQKVGPRINLTFRNVVKNKTDKSKKLRGNLEISKKLALEENKGAMIKQQLQDLGLERVEITADGNCLYRAISRALWKDQEKHKEVRKELASFIVNNTSLILIRQIMTGTSIQEITYKLLKDKEWGGIEAMVAAMHCYKVNIHVIAQGKRMLSHTFSTKNDRKDIYLIYENENHFNLAVEKETEIKGGVGREETSRSESGRKVDHVGTVQHEYTIVATDHDYDRNMKKASKTGKEEGKALGNEKKEEWVKVRIGNMENSRDSMTEREVEEEQEEIKQSRKVEGLISNGGSSTEKLNAEVEGGDDDIYTAINEECEIGVEEVSVTTEQSRLNEYKHALDHKEKESGSWDKTGQGGLDNPHETNDENENIINSSAAEDRDRSGDTQFQTPSLNSINHYRKSCWFWSAGICKFGQICKYAHKKLDKDSKECWNWIRFKRCSFGDQCKYLHSTKPLNDTRFDAQNNGHRRVTQKVQCRQWNRGDCSYGNNCKYLHLPKRIYRYDSNNFKGSLKQKDDLESASVTRYDKEEDVRIRDMIIEILNEFKVTSKE